MSVWRGVDQALAAGTAPLAAHHVRRSPGLIQEHEAVRVHVALPDPPASAIVGDIGPVLLGRPQALFLRVSPLRRSQRKMVEGARTTTPRRASSACNSTSVVSGLALSSERTKVSCSSRIGRLWPPKRAGAALPTDGLAVFYEMLRKKGFTDQELDQMGKQNPATLLGLK